MISNTAAVTLGYIYSESLRGHSVYWQSVPINNEVQVDIGVCYDAKQGVGSWYWLDRVEPENVEAYIAECRELLLKCFRVDVQLIHMVQGG